MPSVKALVDGSRCSRGAGGRGGRDRGGDATAGSKARRRRFGGLGGPTMPTIASRASWSLWKRLDSSVGFLWSLAQVTRVEGARTASRLAFRGSFSLAAPFPLLGWV